jgi:hypothetical protein
MALEAVQGQEFLEPVARRVIDGVALGDTLEFDGVHGVIERKTSVTEEQREWNVRKETKRATAGTRVVPQLRADGTAAIVPRRRYVIARRVRTRSGSAEEAGSRPYCGLVLCTSSF